jgi:hypothetical protein
MPPAPTKRRKRAAAAQEEKPTEQRERPTAPLKPDMAGAVSLVAPMFSAFSAREHLEIEGKLGKWIGNKFIAGVTKTDFFRIHDMLSSYNGWDDNQSLVGRQWLSSFDYFLGNQVRVTKTCAGNAFVRKTLCEQVTFKTNRPYDIRVSLKEEIPVQIRLPQEPTMVRVKKRKSFQLQGQWQFDLTIAWTGENEQEAQNREPSYEVECEFVGPRQGAGPDFHYTAASLLEKLHDFIRDPEAPPLEMLRVQQ